MIFYFKNPIWTTAGQGGARIECGSIGDGWSWAVDLYPVLSPRIVRPGERQVWKSVSTWPRWGRILVNLKRPTCTPEMLPGHLFWAVSVRVRNWGRRRSWAWRRLPGRERKKPLRSVRASPPIGRFLFAAQIFVSPLIFCLRPLGFCRFHANGGRHRPIFPRWFILWLPLPSSQHFSVEPFRCPSKYVHVFSLDVTIVLFDAKENCSISRDPLGSNRNHFPFYGKSFYLHCSCARIVEDRLVLLRIQLWYM